MSQDSLFVAREKELGQLDAALGDAIGGRGRIVFVTGEAGSGKTALVTEFARRAQAAHDLVVVAVGQCDAHTGVGDPYLPFREILQLLTGRVEGSRVERVLTGQQAVRLSHMLAPTAQALAEAGSNLVNTFVPGQELISRIRQLATASSVAKAPRPEEKAARREGDVDFIEQRSVDTGGGDFVGRDRTVQGDEIGRDKITVNIYTASGEKVDWFAQLEQLSGRAPAGRVGIDQSHIFEQYTNVLCRLTESHPLLLVVDDLQWADTGSTGLLFRLGRRIAKSRILVVGTYRPSEVAMGRGGERHPLETVVNEMKRLFGDIEINLDLDEQNPDDKEATDAFVRAYIQRRYVSHVLDEAFHQLIAERTEGNALFVVEILRHLEERGWLAQNKEGVWHQTQPINLDDLPAQIEAVIDERVARLDQPQRVTLMTASVEGEEFTAEVVACVESVDERMLKRQLSRELAAVHGIVADRGFAIVNGTRLARFGFQHSLFQQRLYEQLGEAERADLHCQVGVCLEKLYEDHTDQIAARLARHFEQAYAYARAAKYLIVAGHQAKASYASLEAMDYYRRAVVMPQVKRLPANTRLELLLGLAEVEVWRDELEAAMQHLEMANQLARASHEKRLEAAALRQMAEIHYIRREVEMQRQKLAKAIQLSKAINDKNGEADALWSLARLNVRMGDSRQFETMFRQALELQREINDVDGQAWSLWQLGRIYGYQARFREAEELHQEALKLFSKAGDRRGEAEALSHLGMQQYHRGQFDDALASLEAAVGLGRKAGLIRIEAWALVHKARVHLDLGELGEAEDLLSQARGYFVEIDYPKGQAWCWTVMAILRSYQGNLSVSENLVNRALMVFEQVQDKRSLSWGLWVLARTQCERDNWAEAAVALQKALGVLAEVDQMQWLPVVCATLGRVKLAPSQTSKALEYAEKARKTSTPVHVLGEGLTWRVMGKVRAALEQNDEAQRAFERSIAALEKTDFRLELGISYRAYAEFLSSTGRARDAREYLAKARGIFKAAGAVGELRKVKRIAEQLEAHG